MDFAASQDELAYSIRTTPWDLALRWSGSTRDASWRRTACRWSLRWRCSLTSVFVLRIAPVAVDFSGKPLEYRVFWVNTQGLHYEAEV